VIVVTGSTGKLGGRVARRLADLGVPQRLLVRDAARAPTLPGAEVVTADYTDQASMRAAVDGADTLFFVSGHEVKGRVAVHRSVVDSAIQGGVGRIVYTSFLAAEPDATFTFARDHYLTELHIRGAGVAFTFLRNSLYLDDLPEWVNDDGVIAGPAGDGRVAWVARDDIADVAAAVLTSAGHDEKTYDVTGAEALTLDETAAALSTVLGRPVRYHAETLAEARASRSVHGAPDWEVEGWVTSYAAIATGELSTVSDTVARVAGHEPRTIQSLFADRNARA
jgi:uncharacterized protein YbjT (DUF2867 family)